MLLSMMMMMMNDTSTTKADDYTIATAEFGRQRRKQLLG
jgi:uncharacterized protein YeeX (DUF496 family)